MGMAQSPDTPARSYHGDRSATGRIAIFYSAESVAGTSVRGFALPPMDRFWLAVVVSGILVLITVVGLIAFVPRDADTVAQAPVYSVGRGRH